MSEEKKMGLWSRLNGDVLRTIAGEKLCLEDYIRFQSVCKHWNSSIDNPSSCLRRPQLPWLMLPYCRQHTTSRTSSTSCCRCFYSISDGKTHHIQFPPGYDDDKRCFGSSHGWLIMVDETCPSIFLLNPLTTQRIELPPHDSFPDVLDFHPHRRSLEYLVQYLDSFQARASFLLMAKHHISKIVLSSDPTLPNCIAVAIYGDTRGLAYCRVGQDHNWTQVLHNDGPCLAEVIFWKGAFYAAGFDGSLSVFHPNTTSNSPPKADWIIGRGKENRISGIGKDRHYLVADSLLDELVLVCKIICTEGDDDDDDDDRYRTSKIDVYSLNQEKKLWEKKQSLGGKVLFLGSNHTLWFSAADYPELKPNTVYFTDDYLEGYEKGILGGHDVGIFDMDDGVVKPLPCCDPHASFAWPPPIWVTPSLAATSSPST